MIFIGIDNGVSGTIGIITPIGSQFFQTPHNEVFNYTKKKQKIKRIDWNQLHWVLSQKTQGQCSVAIERPFSGKFAKPVVSGARAFEATIIVMEMLSLPYQVIDSKEWQKVILPSGIKGSAELKKASMQMGCQLFPEHAEAIKKHKDADGILIAEYLRRTYQPE